jgi:hypothetical protein
VGRDGDANAQAWRHAIGVDHPRAWQPMPLPIPRREWPFVQRRQADEFEHNEFGSSNCVIDLTGYASI